MTKEERQRYDREYYQKHKVRIDARIRKNPKRKEFEAKWRHENKARISKRRHENKAHLSLIKKQWGKIGGRKVAHWAVERALKNGKLVHPNCCERCGRIVPIEAHHDDYTKPLQVLWVCDKCHRLIHQILKTI
jgi:hypothetical protein